MNACTGWQPAKDGKRVQNDSKENSIRDTEEEKKNRTHDRKKTMNVYFWWFGMRSLSFVVLLLVNAFYDFDTYWQMSHFHCCHSVKLSSICSMRAYNIQPSAHIQYTNASNTQPYHFNTHTHTVSEREEENHKYAFMHTFHSSRANVISRLLLVCWSFQIAIISYNGACFVTIMYYTEFYANTMILRDSVCHNSF